MLNGQISPMLRLPLVLTTVMLALFWVATAVLYFTRMDLTPASVVSHFLGSAEEFSMPRTLPAMIEVSHAHLAMMAVVLLLLTHLTVFLPWRAGMRRTLIVTAFSAALLDEGSGWLVRFVSPRLAILKIVGFVTLELALLVLLIGVASWLARRLRVEGG